MMGNYNPGMYDTSASSAPRQSSKMPLIIIGAVVFVILVVVIIILSMGGTPVSSESALSDYKLLANYVVNNKSDEVLDTSIDPSGSIEITRRAQNYEQNTDYFKKAEEKAKAVISSARRSTLNAENKSKLTDYANAIIAYSKLKEFETYRAGLVEQYMADKNYDKSLNSVNDHYKDLVESGNEDLKTAGQQLISAGRLYLSIVNELSVNNKNVREFETSLKEFYSEEQIYSYDIQIDNAYNTARKKIMTEFNKQIKESWNYAKLLEGSN